MTTRGAIAAVEGPQWTTRGLDEAAGRFPLRVEGAVGRLVEFLLPGVITTTRHARYYSLHVVAWAEAATRGLKGDDAATFVRRCEVVAAGIHHAHSAHVRQLSSAHGEDRIRLFLRDGELDVLKAAAKGRTGLSMNGFAGVYQGALVRMGLLTGDSTPKPGERADVPALREGLEDLLVMADQDSLSESDLTAASHLCLCRAPESPDGIWLRRFMFEEPQVGNEEDLRRVLTAQMLLEALSTHEGWGAEAAFRLAHGFGGPIEGHDLKDAVSRAWRGAILRNYSVSAWRELWRWLAEQLRAEPMTIEELAGRFIDEVEGGTVADLLSELPRRSSIDQLLPAEETIRDAPSTPRSCLQLLALGALRLDDLSGQTLHAFTGREGNDLGPAWVRRQLEEFRNDGLPALARHLTEILIRRARRVALSKMELRNGRVWIPTRLRERNGVYSVVESEGAGEVALRQGTLSEVLLGLDLLTRGADGSLQLTPLGEALRDRNA